MTFPLAWALCKRHSFSHSINRVTYQIEGLRSEAIVSPELLFANAVCDIDNANFLGNFSTNRKCIAYRSINKPRNEIPV